MKSPSKLLNVLKKDLLFCWIMTTTALCLGLLLNQLRDKPLPLSYQSKTERLEQAVSRVVAEPSAAAATVTVLPKELSLEQFRSYVESKQVLVLDARPEIFHRLGHVPGALSLPREDFETAYTKYRGILEKDKNQPVLIYCSGSSCEDSHLLQTALIRLGFTNLSVFTGGWSDWSKAGLPEEKNL